MSCKNKKIVSAIVASLITITPNLYSSEKIKRSESCNFGRYALNGTLAIATAAAAIAGKKIYNHYSYEKNDLFNDYNENCSDNNQNGNKNKEPTIFVSEFCKNTEQEPSPYLISLAVQHYRSKHPTGVSCKKMDDYRWNFKRCYPAAAMLYGLDKLGIVTSEEEAQAESTVLRSIVDDILKITGIEQIWEPRRMVAFYIFSQFKGNFNKWLNIVKEHRPQFLKGQKFCFPCLNVGSFLFDRHREAYIIGCLRNTMLRIEKNDNGWSIISEECLGVEGLNDRMELTISADNRKTLSYVYESPSCRSQCNLVYGF